jgi:MFS family permease
MGGFWLVAGVLFLLFFAAAAPSPLYDVYRAQWRFSAATLTAVFAVYALVLLVTLLVFGSISDYLGRRPVILAGLAMTAAGCGFFLTAHDVGLLFAAYFIASYLAFSIPVVVAGMATTRFGLHRTALVYCAVIAVLAAVAAGSLIVRRRSRG